MTQKAKVGGTPSRAPVGYLNVGRERDDGKEIRTVEIDPLRAPTVQWAFEVYSTGEWTLTELTDTLQARGLTSIPNGRGAGLRPVSRSQVANMLSNRYYLSYVSFRGIEYEGRHQPLVHQALFDRVQEVLRSHRHAGKKRRKHHHYLKGSVFCGECGSRLLFTRANGHGGTYDYFVCLGRHQKRTDCRAKWTSIVPRGLLRSTTSR